MDKDEDAFGKRCDDAEINLTTVVAFLFWSRTNCPARRLRVHSKCVLNMLFSLLLQVHPLVSSFERCVCVCASVQRPKSKDGNGQIDLLYVVCMQVYCSHSDAHTLLLFMSLPSSCHYQSVLFALHESVTTKHEPICYRSRLPSPLDLPIQQIEIENSFGQLMFASPSTLCSILTFMS